jgi:hypothetical protein
MFIGPPGTENKDEREKKKERIKQIMMMTWDIEMATSLCYHFTSYSQYRIFPRPYFLSEICIYA